MDLDAGTLLAIAGAIVGAIGALNSWRTARTSAKKDEVDVLRGIIETQSEHIAAQDERIDRLEAERAELRSELEATRSRLTEVEAQHDSLCDWVRDKLGYDPIKRKPITQPLSGGAL